jgi:thiol-disulfide isomerase/thioredoxin
MVKTALFILATAFFGPISWHYDLREAENLAQKEHRHVLLNFSGSDWCGPCIRMHKEIFEKDVFLQMADSELIMVNADFPRMKKNQLPSHQQDLNNAMADKYNPKGKFPLTLLLTADGKVLKAWDGFPNGTPEDFVHQVITTIAADK